MSEYIEKKYAALDQAILAAISFGKTQHCIICMDKFVDAHAERYATTNSPAFRIVDRRMQALRRRGVLKYERISGWRISK
jgi:hypothetical protein